MPLGETFFVVGPDGDLIGRDNLGAEITALPRPGEHRIDPPALLAGDKKGVLHILRRTERKPEGTSRPQGTIADIP